MDPASATHANKLQNWKCGSYKHSQLKFAAKMHSIGSQFFLTPLDSMRMMSNLPWSLCFEQLQLYFFLLYQAVLFLLLLE